MPQRQHVFEHRFVRLRRPRALPPCFEAAPQRLPLLLGSVEPLTKDIALTPAVLQLGVEAAPAWKAGNQITHENCEPAHWKAIISPR